MLTRLVVIGVRTFGDRIIIASVLFSFKTSPLSRSHTFTECRRHTGDVACYAAVTVSLTEQRMH